MKQREKSRFWEILGDFWKLVHKMLDNSTLGKFLIPLCVFKFSSMYFIPRKIISP